MKPTQLMLFVIALIACSVLTDAVAQRSPTAKRDEALHVKVLDVDVYDQNGKQLKFYTDLVKGKIVAINFIFTTCTNICPPLGATFAKAQKLMNDRTGKDVHLISVTLD